MANPLGSVGGLSTFPINKERLFAMIERRTIPNRKGCLIWQGYCLKGYPQGAICGHMRLMHRALWIAVHGEIPARMQVDHECDNEKCLNIEHLSIKTPRDNTLRSSNPCAKHFRQKRCHRGHKFDRFTFDGKGRKRRGCSKCETMRNRSKPEYVKVCAPAGWRPPSRGGSKASGSNSGSGELDHSAPAGD